MVKRLIFLYFIAFIIVLCCSVQSVIAVELEDFTGGVSTARVTINPASIGAIDRFHTQYEFFGYQGENIPRITPFADATYDKGIVGHGKIDLVVPFSWGSIGFSQDGSTEIYSSSDDLTTSANGYLCDMGLSNCQLGLGSYALTSLSTKAEIINSLTSASIGFSFLNSIIGIRYNQRRNDFNYSYDYSISNPGISSEDTFNTNITYNYIDYGIIVPSFLNIFDIGISFRPEITTPTEVLLGSSNLDGNMVLGGPVNAIYWDNNIYLDDPTSKSVVEPSRLIFGLGMTFNFGNSALQFIFDRGTIGNTDISSRGPRIDNSLEGNLARLVIGSFIDISYGVQTQDLGVLKLTTETYSFQFPFFEGSNFKLGLRTITLSDINGTEIVQFSFPKVSFNVQIGEQVSRALTVKPKTKEITFIDRL